MRTALAGSLGNVGKNLRSLIEKELELARVKEELDTVQMERDILKKAAAYFAKRSLPARNLLDHEFMTDASNQIWLTDIASISTDEGWLYLAVHKDL